MGRRGIPIKTRKDQQRWGGGRKCTSGSPKRQRQLGSPCGCAADPSRPLGTPAATLACERLGCLILVLHTSSPQARHMIVRALGPEPVGEAQFPRGFPPGDPGPSSHPTLSQLFKLAETLPFCSRAATRQSYAQLARPHIVPEPRSATSKWLVRYGSEGAPEIPSAAKQQHQATPAHTLYPNPPAIMCSPHPTPTVGVSCWDCVQL